MTTLCSAKRASHRRASPAGPAHVQSERSRAREPGGRRGAGRASSGRGAGLGRRGKPGDGRGRGCPRQEPAELRTWRCLSQRLSGGPHMLSWSFMELVFRVKPAIQPRFDRIRMCINAWAVLRSVTLVVSDPVRPHGLWPAWLLCPWDSPGKNTGVGWHALLQGIFPTQGSDPRFSHLQHWQVGSLPLAHLGTP